MSANKVHSAEQPDQIFPEQKVRPIGAAAVSAESDSVQGATEFVYKTPEELLERIVEHSTLNGYDIDRLEYKDQPGFTDTVHSIINSHFTSQHRKEWDSNQDGAMAPPLPFQWVKSRLATYYSEVPKGDGDKTHEKTVKDLRKIYLPQALSMTDALPEIEAVVEIQALLDDAGKEIAADAVSDLLVVYGITIHFLKEKQAQIRKERQEKAARAARNIGQMLQ